VILDSWFVACDLWFGKQVTPPDLFCPARRRQACDFDINYSLTTIHVSSLYIIPDVLLEIK